MAKAPGPTPGKKLVFQAPKFGTKLGKSGLTFKAPKFGTQLGNPTAPPSPTDHPVVHRTSSEAAPYPY